ncbi:MAG: hypothetical protein IPG79_12840 [Saprospiraceae bacterium]|nr:hypothetical protein [Saprospiraceae bacterium]
MRAWVLSETDVLPTLQYLEDPKPVSENQRLIRIVNSSLNHRDIWIGKGQYPNIVFPCVPGSDGSGYMDNEPVIMNPGISWEKTRKSSLTIFTLWECPHKAPLLNILLQIKTNT